MFPRSSLKGCLYFDDRSRAGVTETGAFSYRADDYWAGLLDSLHSANKTEVANVGATEPSA